MAMTRRNALTTTSAVALLSLALGCHGAQAQETQQAVDLGTIIIPVDPITGQPINPDDNNNSGETTLDDTAVEYRATNQDANTAIATLPNVQTRSDVGRNRSGYANGLNDDIGERADDALDLKPQELSISGAAVNENNIMIDGVGVNAVTHPTTVITPSDSAAPQLYYTYGLHSQTQFVPTTFVDEVEYYDSNVSAKYGGFLGGVVNYKLRKPQLGEARGSSSFSYQTQDFTKYSLATEDGDNPQNRAKPNWTKMSYSFDYSTPISENTSILFAYSTQRASTDKQRSVQYGSGWVNSKSKSDFYRAGIVHQFDNGGEFTASVNFTDYNQSWDLPTTNDFHMDIATQSLMGDFGYSKDVGDVGFVRNAKLDIGLSLQNNKVSNKTGSTQYYNWSGYNRSADLSASLDFCTPDASLGSVQNCVTGGVGDTTFEDNQIGFSVDLTGDVGNGSFRAGFEAEHYDVNRTGTGFDNYTNTFQNFAGLCTADDPTCNPEQYFWYRVSQDAYDVDVNAHSFGLYAEADQTFGDWTLRGGLRADYNSVLKNVDVAPRLSTTWKARENFSMTIGANRYYDDNYLAYAVHDALPGIKSDLRFDPLGTWATTVDQGLRSYTSGDLKTPYNDEFTLAFSYRDSWTDGIWRLRGLHRKGKDLFAQSETTAGDETANTLTNEGFSEYNAIVLEYQKSWESPNLRNLDGVGLYTSLTWSDRKTSHNSYFANDTALPRRIWYNGQGYVGEDWNKVTGNLDIPLRGALELRSSWFNGGLRVGLAADVTAGYTGVIDTGDNYRNPADGISYNLFEDHKFNSIVKLNLNSSIRMMKLNNGEDLRLDVKVNNLLDKKPNGTATDSNPWVGGRSVWVGVNMTF